MAFRKSSSRLVRSRSWSSGTMQMKHASALGNSVWKIPGRVLYTQNVVESIKQWQEVTLHILWICNWVICTFNFSIKSMNDLRFLCLQSIFCSPIIFFSPSIPFSFHSPSFQNNGTKLPLGPQRQQTVRVSLSPQWAGRETAQPSGAATCLLAAAAQDVPHFMALLQLDEIFRENKHAPPKLGTRES